MNRKTLLATAGLVAGVTLVGAPAYADHGGRSVYYISGKYGVPFRAPANDPTARTRLAGPGSGYPAVLAVQPSPDRRHLLEWVIAQTPSGYGVRVVVTDRNGRHRRVLWARDAEKAHHLFHDWTLAGITWSGDGRRVYFTGVDTASDYRQQPVQRTSTAILRTARVSAKGVPGRVHPVPGGEGLSWPTSDPTSDRVAAVRVDSQHCAADTDTSTRSTIVVLGAAGGGTDLLTVTTPAADCALPMQHLAWSPDGSQIAFDQQSLRGAYWKGQIDSVAVDGSDGDTPRVLVPDDDVHLVADPAWRNADALWYTRQLRDDGDSDATPRTLTDLFSVTIDQGVAGDPVRHTRTAKRSEDAPSFG